MLYKLILHSNYQLIVSTVTVKFLTVIFLQTIDKGPRTKFTVITKIYVKVISSDVLYH